MVQLTDKVFAVEVPDDAENTRVSQLIGSPKLFADLPGYLFATKLPPGSWRFLFTTKGVKKIPNGIVECKIVQYDGKVKGTRFVNYTNPNQRTWFINKSDSLKSLLRSKGLDPDKNYALIEKESSDADLKTN